MIKTKKVLTDPKIKRFELRLSEPEYKQLLEMEGTLGINRTEIIRSRVLQDSNKVLVNAKELLQHLDAIGAELGRSGNNINQLARHANTLNKQNSLDPAIAVEFNTLMIGHNQLHQSLEVVMRKVIRLMGK